MGPWRAGVCRWPGPSRPAPTGRLARDPPSTGLGPEETCVRGRGGGGSAVRGQGSGWPRGVSSPRQSTRAGPGPGGRQGSGPSWPQT